MALFGGGKKAERPPPVDRVRAMVQSGMAEKDIIRQLKAEGYSFGEVEKAMMAVVKEGAAPAGAGMAPAGPEPATAGYGTQYAQQQYAPQPPQPAYGYEQYPPPPAYAPPPSPYSSPASQARYDMPAAAGSPYYGPPPGPPAESMEDLVEGVLEEKFEKFSAETKALRDEISKVKSEIGSVKSMAMQRTGGEGELPKDVSDRIEELEARIGGLEKAFRQFMPVLSENVEAIKKAVHGEMREEGRARREM